MRSKITYSIKETIEQLASIGLPRISRQRMSVLVKNKLKQDMKDGKGGDYVILDENRIGIYKSGVEILKKPRQSGRPSKVQK